MEKEQKNQVAKLQQVGVFIYFFFLCHREFSGRRLRVKRDGKLRLDRPCRPPLAARTLNTSLVTFYTLSFYCPVSNKTQQHTHSPSLLPLSLAHAKVRGGNRGGGGWRRSGARVHLCVDDVGSRARTLSARQLSRQAAGSIR